MFEKLFSKRGLSLDRLRVLVEVAEAGGISRAVNGDPFRQSQYSRQLKELEDFFEVELTRRHGKSLKLTPAGERLACLIRESFTGLCDFAAECAAEPVVFAIGAGDSLIRWSLLPQVGKLKKDIPTANLKLFNMRTADVIRGLQNLSLDFGIVRADAITANLQGKPLGRVEYGLFVPSLLAGGTQKKQGLPPVACAKLLNTLPMANLGGHGEFTAVMDEQMKRAKLAMNVQLQCESFPSLCHAVATGKYAAVLPLIARSELPETSVRVYESAFFNPLIRTIHLVWNPRILRLRPVAERVRDWMKLHLRF